MFQSYCPVYEQWVFFSYTKPMLKHCSNVSLLQTQIYVPHETIENCLVAAPSTFLGRICKRPHLVQRDHGVGHGEDEVDVVLRHFLCDQSQRWVILSGRSRRCGRYMLTSVLTCTPCPCPTITSTQYVHAYHCCRHAVHVLGVQVAFPIVWPHDPGQTTV